MKQQIDNLIANSILNEREIFLPNIGTLILYRHPAKQLSAKRLQSPYNELRLTSEERGVDITHLIAKVANVSEERASDIYAEWHTQSLHDGTLAIGGVCSITNNVVTTDSNFVAMANPDGVGVVTIKPRTNYYIYGVVCLCVVLSLGIAGYILYPQFATQEVAQSASEQPQVVAEPIAEPLAEAIAEVTEVVEVAEQPAEPTLPALKKGNSYAVWGVYDHLKSAEDAMAWIKAKLPEIDAKIYIYDSRYMIALCEESSRSACARKVTAWKKQHKSCQSVWVYTRNK